MTTENILWQDRKRPFFGLPLSFTVYKLTETKLYTRIGLFNIRQDEIELYKIVDKKMELPFFQRIFNCGTLILSGRDADTPIKRIQKIKNPEHVLNLISDYLNKERDKYSIRGRDMTGTADENSHL